MRDCVATMEGYSTRSSNKDTGGRSDDQNTSPDVNPEKTGIYFFAAAVFAAASAYFVVERPTRPAVSRSFCLPVKNGWKLEQVSTRSMSPLTVERVGKV